MVRTDALLDHAAQPRLVARDAELDAHAGLAREFAPRTERRARAVERAELFGARGRGPCDMRVVADREVVHGADAVDHALHVPGWHEHADAIDRRQLHRVRDTACAATSDRLRHLRSTAARAGGSRRRTRTRCAKAPRHNRPTAAAAAPRRLRNVARTRRCAARTRRARPASAT